MMEFNEANHLLNKAREDRRKMLETQLKKLKNDISEICRSFDRKLEKLFHQKLEVFESKTSIVRIGSLCYNNCMKCCLRNFENRVLPVFFQNLIFEGDSGSKIEKIAPHLLPKNQARRGVVSFSRVHWNQKL